MYRYRPRPFGPQPQPVHPLHMYQACPCMSGLYSTSSSALRASASYCTILTCMNNIVHRTELLGMLRIPHNPILCTIFRLGAPTFVSQSSALRQSSSDPRSFASRSFSDQLRFVRAADACSTQVVAPPFLVSRPPRRGASILVIPGF